MPLLRDESSRSGGHAAAFRIRGHSRPRAFPLRARKKNRPLQGYGPPCGTLPWNAIMGTSEPSRHGSDRSRMSRFCPQCGSQMRETAKFCSGCGSKLRQRQAINPGGSRPAPAAPPPPP
ncbi:MAG: zinc-ribbon domain-containing protein, partial [Candidatus Eremiobacterota bacterium]